MCATRFFTTGRHVGLGAAVGVEPEHRDRLEHPGGRARALVGTARDARRERRHVDVGALGSREERRQIGPREAGEATDREVRPVLGVRHEHRAARRERAQPVHERSALRDGNALQHLAGENRVAGLHAERPGEAAEAAKGRDLLVAHAQAPQPAIALERASPPSRRARAPRRGRRPRAGRPRASRRRSRSRGCTRTSRAAPRRAAAPATRPAERAARAARRAAAGTSAWPRTRRQSRRPHLRPVRKDRESGW